MKRIFCFVLSLALMCGILSLSISAAEYEVNYDSPLAGIKIGFFGDSICAGADSWAPKIGTANDMEWTNNGKSAASVSNCRGTNTIFAQVEKTIEEEYEMIILHGGTNDAWDNAPIGKMTHEDDFSNYDSYNPKNFAGGLERLFSYIRENNPDAIVAYIINFKFINASRGEMVDAPDGNGGTKKVYRLNYMEDYVEMIKQVCDKWDVPYIDLYSNDDITTRLHPKSGSSYLNTYMHDFIHPNAAGYDIITPYIEEFMIELVEASQETEATTTLATTVATQPTTVPETTVPETAETKPGGCGSVIGGSAILAVVTLGTVAVLSKKRKEK